MPGTGHYPRVGWPLSRSFLKQFMGRGTLFEFLQFQAIKDVVFFKDDFLNKALDTTNDWSVAAGNTATTWASLAGLSGLIRGISGTTAATSGLQLISPFAWYSGDQNAGMEIRFRVSDITERRLEVGFVDALPSVNTKIVNSLSTPTFNTTAQGAVYLYNHTGSTTTSGLYMIGSDVAASKVATTTNRPVNSTFQTVRIQTEGDAVYCWVDGILLASSTAQSVQGGDALKLAVSVVGSSTNDSNNDIDYILAWADRT